MLVVVVVVGRRGCGGVVGGRGFVGGGLGCGSVRGAKRKKNKNIVFWFLF